MKYLKNGKIVVTREELSQRDELMRKEGAKQARWGSGPPMNGGYCWGSATYDPRPRRPRKV